MTDVQIESGTLIASLDDRTVSGLLVPFGEEGRTNLGRFSVHAGALTLPRDPQSVTLNLDHDREQPIARATLLAEAADGIHATFRFFDTDEGDAALSEFRTGKRQKLSVEAKGMVLRAGKAVAGRIFGAAQLEAGAFPSATLMAADVGETTQHLEDTFTDADGVTWSRVVDTTTETDQDKTTTTTVAVEEITEPDTTPDDTEKEDDTVPDATAPNTLTARDAKTPRGLSFIDLTRTLARARATGDPTLYATIAAESSAGESLFAALNDVKFDAAGSAGLNISALPQWLGELWSGRAFQRRIIPLIGSGPMTSLKIAGWRWLVKPEVAPWAGNKSAVPTNTPTTEAYDVTGKRLAGAHDVAREYRDFDVPGFWEGYWRGMTESYDRQADLGTLEDLLVAATPVIRGTVPADVAPGMVSIVDGALAIIDEALPSFAIVAKDVYRQILLTRNDDTLAYLNAALGLEDGTIQNFRVVPHAGLDAGDVLVGAKEAATSYELPGVPIRVEGLDMVKGGIDPGLFGYYGTVIHDEAALALVSPPAP